jgi:hypothetical protein
MEGFVDENKLEGNNEVPLSNFSTVTLKQVIAWMEIRNNTEQPEQFDAWNSDLLKMNQNELRNLVSSFCVVYCR